MKYLPRFLRFLVVQRYLAIKKENKFLRDKIAQLESQLAIYKLSTGKSGNNIPAFEDYDEYPKRPEDIIMSPW